jgi:hypothetical protein
VCIYVGEGLSFNKINISLHCSELTLEVCGVELETKSSDFRMLALYRAPSASLNEFIDKLNATPKILI